MTVNVGLFDRSFRPDASTVRGRTPKYWNYVTQGNPAIVVRTHGEIFQNFQGVPKERQFGMAWESSAILPELYSLLRTHSRMLKNHYAHIFTYDPTLLKEDSELFKYAPAYAHWMDTEYGGPAVAEKTKTCSLVISDKQMAPGHGLRAWCGQRYGSIGMELFGAGVGRPFGKTSEVIAPYRFHLAIENSVCDNYITEKVLNCFACGTVPIYWGAGNLGNWFNMDGVIRFEDFVEGMKNAGSIDDCLCTVEFERRKAAIEDNKERVKEWAKPIEDYIHENYFMEKL